MRKTHDDIHHYRGLWRDGGRCRIEVDAPEAGKEGRCPVIVAAERDDNAGSSVTNMAEYLAAAVVARHFPHLLDASAVEGQPVVWREHYPPRRGGRGKDDRVTFAPWRIRATWLGGTLRRALGAPAWARLDRAGGRPPEGRSVAAEWRHRRDDAVFHAGPGRRARLCCGASCGAFSCPTPGPSAGVLTSFFTQLFTALIETA